MTSLQPAAAVPERRFTPVERACELCGENDFEPLWRLAKQVRTRSSLYRFDHAVGACRRCGFVYVQPGYRGDELARYYADSFPNWLGAPNHTWDQRLAFIARHARSDGSEFLEIGGNNDAATVDRLTAAGFHVLRFDQNDAAPRDFATLEEVPSGSIDVVAHYYTLEHVDDAVAFLRECRRILVAGGLMICEVPDLDRYTLDPAEQLGAVEHMRHFTGTTLVQLAQRAGFDALGLSYVDVSKPCGFAAAFRAADRPAHAPAFVAAATRVREGATLIDAFDQRTAELAAFIDAYATPAAPVIVWGANPITAELVGVLRGEPGSVIVLDDDPLKAEYFATVPVRKPDAAVDALRRASFMVSSRRHLVARFLDRAHALSGRAFGPESFAVMDHGVCEFDPAALGTRASK